MANFSKRKRTTPEGGAEEALEIPDVFDLRPLATQRITLLIREIRPARFYYVPDEDDLNEQSDEPMT